jgi:uncharacterized protein with NRDE domain
MCLIAFAIGASPRWPLVIAANRDEYWARPTSPLALWHTPHGSSVLSGRDLRAGGTWMGASPGGRVAFLTNVREADRFGAPGALPLISRGNLVTRWLDGVDTTPAAMVTALQRQAHSAAMDYAGFNLVVGDAVRGHWHWIRHQRTGQPRAAGDTVNPWSIQRLSPGVFGLSNAALDTPWPKTTRLKSALTDALVHADSADALTDTLWRALQDPTRCTPEALPSTGVPPAVEMALSSVFVDFPEQAYGTRSSAVWLATAGGSAVQPWHVSAEERTFAGAASAPTVASHAMQWTPCL